MKPDIRLSLVVLVIASTACNEYRNAINHKEIISEQLVSKSDTIKRLNSDLVQLDKSEISIFTKHKGSIDEVNRQLDSVRNVRGALQAQLVFLNKELDSLKQEFKKY